MEMTHHDHQAPQTTLFTPTTKPVMRRVSSYIEPAVYDELTEVAAHEGLELSATIRELLAIALRYYKFKKGTLNPTHPHNDKTFYCQICGQLTKVRNMHTVIVMNDVYSFCEPCFFADKYKGFVVSLINRM